MTDDAIGRLHRICADLEGSGFILKDAVMGWLYGAMFAQDCFTDGPAGPVLTGPVLTGPVLTGAVLPPLPPPSGNGPAAAALRRLHDIRAGLPPARTAGGGGLDVLVVGGGPVGLAAGIALRLGGGPRLRIGIHERRLDPAEPAGRFTRHWLTNIPVELVRPMLLPEDLALLATAGSPPYIGAQLSMLEALLHRHAQALDIPYIDAPPEAHRTGTGGPHLVIDASGGRLEREAGPVDRGGEAFEFGFAEPPAITDIDGYGVPGPPRAVARIAVHPTEDGHSPFVDGRRIRYAMLKIRNISAGDRDAVLAAARPFLADNGVYVWPGRFAPEGDELLVFFNLRPEEHELLAGGGTGQAYLPDLLDCGLLRESRGDRPRQFLERLHGALSRPAAAVVEPPFVWSPYYRPRVRRRLFGAPVMAVGDSVFNGNPKMGNGLGPHLVEIVGLQRLLTGNG